MDIRSKIQRSHQNQRHSINSKFVSKTALSKGTYADTSENRKLGRVGQEYGSKKSEEKPNSKKFRFSDDKKSFQESVSRMRREFDNPDTKPEKKERIKEWLIGAKEHKKTFDSQKKDFSKMNSKQLESHIGVLEKQDVKGYKEFRELKDNSQFSGKEFDVRRVQAFKTYRENLRKYVSSK